MVSREFSRGTAGRDGTGESGNRAFVTKYGLRDAGCARRIRVCWFLCFNGFRGDLDELGLFPPRLSMDGTITIDGTSSNNDSQSFYDQALTVSLDDPQDRIFRGHRPLPVHGFRYQLDVPLTNGRNSRGCACDCSRPV